jgi:proteasome lid subunit RPN8/RPN11
MQVHIGATLLNRIMAEAADAPAQEICGLLFGQPGRIEAAERAANVADDPERTFEIEPAALFMAIRLERQGGPRLVGHYHSHPNGSTEPSPRDLAAAEPGRLWLIVGDARARLWLAEAGSFREVQLIVT